MNILLEETKKGTWEISIVPTTEEDLARGQPTSGEIALTLLGISRDLFSGVVGEQRKKEPGSVIQMPSPADIKGLNKGR